MNNEIYQKEMKKVDVMNNIREYQSGKEPEKEICNLIKGYIEIMLPMMKMTPRVGKFVSFGGGPYTASNLVDKVDHLLMSSGGKLAKDVFGIEDVRDERIFQNVMQNSVELVNYWFIRGFIPPITLKMMEGEYVDYILYDPADSKSKDNCFSNRVSILYNVTPKHMDLGHKMKEVKRQWRETTESDEERLNQLMSGDAPPKVVALLDLTGYIFLLEAQQEGYLPGFGDGKKKLLQILMMMAVRLGRIVYENGDRMMIHGMNNPATIQLLINLRKVITAWYFCGLLVPMKL